MIACGLLQAASSFGLVCATAGCRYCIPFGGGCGVRLSPISFVCSTVDRHLGRLCFLTIRNSIAHIWCVCVCICACALTCAGGQKRVLVFSPGVELQGCESHDVVAGDETSQPLQVRQLSLAAEPSPAFSLPSVVLICISLVSSVAEHLSTHGCPCCVLHRTACSYRRSFLNRITLSFC